MIRLDHISLRYSLNRWAVFQVSLEVKRGERLALLGTSGSGKSSTLKMINGLVRPTEGILFFEGNPLDYKNIYSLRLKMGYVIQGAGLFPHMTVFENISIMARMLKWDPKRMKKRVEELLALVGLDKSRFLNQYPSELSGGEQQRVGVARALMLDPPVLLMDEPFGALDPMTRRKLQEDFLRLEDQIRKTVVLVTHDLEEAFRLADRVALLHDGRFIQCDTPENIQKNPADDFVREFLK